jgi:hypothetical protein
MVIETPIEDTPDESAEPKVSEGSEEISEAVQDAQAPPEKAPLVERSSQPEPKKRGRPKKTEPPPEPKKKPGRPKKDSAQAPSERSSQPPTQAPSDSQPPVLSASHEDPFRATLDTMSSAALVAELVNRRRASERQMKQELYRSFVM